MFAAMSLAGGAALFTILGFRDLFEPTILITLMAASIEFGKIVAVSAMYQLRNVINWYWKSIVLIMILASMLVTSMGVYGYLSSAYQRDSLKLTQSNTQLQNIIDRKAVLEARITSFDKQIADIAPNYITKRIELINTLKPERVIILSELELLNKQELDFKLIKVSNEVELGGIVLLAKSVDWLDESKSMLYFIALIIFIFDPLAIVLTYIANVGYYNASHRKDEPKEIQSNAMNDMQSGKSKLLDSMRTIASS